MIPACLHFRRLIPIGRFSRAGEAGSEPVEFTDGADEMNFIRLLDKFPLAQPITA